MKNLQVPAHAVVMIVAPVNERVKEHNPTPKRGVSLCLQQRESAMHLMNNR